MPRPLTLHEDRLRAGSAPVFTGSRARVALTFSKNELSEPVDLGILSSRRLRIALALSHTG
jgi:hypothetical protein